MSFQHRSDIALPQAHFPIWTVLRSVRYPQRIGLCEGLRWGQRTLQRRVF